LKRSIELNGYANISVLQVALSDGAGSAILRIGSTSGGHTLSPEYGGLRSVTVPTTTLDSVVAEQGLQRVDMLKIDVQEWEIEVLRGAEQTLRSNPQLVLLLDLPTRMEMRRAIAGFLAPFGFTYFPDCDEQWPTGDIPPTGFEVAAIWA
jgi:FkbM family methyltransferase